MNTDIAYTPNKDDLKARGAASGTKGMILKIVKAFTFDAEAIFKSKDWPHLWSK
jgi:hypothetical protein